MSPIEQPYSDNVKEFKKDQLLYTYGITNMKIYDNNDDQLMAVFERENNEKYGRKKSKCYVYVPKNDQSKIASKLASLFTSDFVFWFIDEYGLGSGFKS